MFFSNSGSEANETALKLIRGYQKLRGTPREDQDRQRARSRYHGVDARDDEHDRACRRCTEPFDLPLPGFVQVPGPVRVRREQRHDAERVRRVVPRGDRAHHRCAKAPATIAALFAEPIQGAGGVIVPPPGYLRALRELCRRHDILFVADEVITGFGRLGAWFASELWDLEPDLMTHREGHHQRLPAARRDAGERRDRRRARCAAATSRTASPTAATRRDRAPALANLEIIEREKLVERVRDDVGPYFQAEAARARRASRGRRGARLRPHRRARAACRAAAAPTLTPHRRCSASRRAALAREEGVIVRGIRDLIALSPPLIVTHDEIDAIFAAVERGLDRLWG